MSHALLNKYPNLDHLLKYSYTKNNAYISSQEIDLNLHKLSVHNQQDTTLFSCDECNFADQKEENVLNHKIRMHTTYTCELCNFKCTQEQNLELHIRKNK